MLSEMKSDEFDYVFKIMDESFPNTEMRVYEGQKNLLLEDKYSIIVKRNDSGDIQGIISCWDLTDFKYIEHFAVDKNQRGNNIGGKMITEFCKSQNRPVVLEVEFPEDDMSIRRIGFYERNGFLMNEYDYLQPPMRKGNDFLPLKIMSTPRSITEKEFKTLKDDLYNVVYKYKK